MDVVLFTIERGALATLLVQVKDGPYAGRWAFPGGRVPLGEAPERTAARELEAQTGLRDLYLEQLRTFGDPARDPEAHVVSIAYFALVPLGSESAAVSPKYTGARWVAAAHLPALAYDHRRMAEHAIERLRAKLGYTNIVYSLLPHPFTLSELQQVYEIILDRPLDRRNFRKKIQSTGLLQRVADQRRGAHRPAQLYRFIRRAPMNVALL